MSQQSSGPPAWFWGGFAVVCICTFIWMHFDTERRKSENILIYGRSDIPTDRIRTDRIISVKETSKGGDIGVIGGGKKGPRGFRTAERKMYEVTYEDENGVIRTKTMSSDPTR